jgi:signal transduction histidine kinase
VSQQALPADRRTRWWQTLAFWTLVVLVSSTRSDVRGDGHTWEQALRMSIAYWSIWALLCPLILRVDRWLPIGREPVSKRLPLRLLAHVPIGLGITVLHAWLAFAVSALLQTIITGTPDGAAAAAAGTAAVARSTATPLFPVDTSPIVSMSMPDAFAHAATSWSIVVYGLIVGLAIAFDYQRHAADRRIKALELEKLLAESRFDTLRTRLHPHVLFNALNAISAHVETDPRQARWILEQFGSMLRLSLEHDREPEIPLERELAYVECYLDLQKVRFEDRFEVITKVDPDVLDAYVPTFILQPLVENALRHGVLTRSTPGQILIEAWRENGSLRLSVRDDGPGLPADWDAAGGSGVGLTNTRERLHRLYGKDQSLDIAAAPGSGVHVALTLPFRKTRGLRSGESHAESEWQPAVPAAKG